MIYKYIHITKNNIKILGDIKINNVMDVLKMYEQIINKNTSNNIIIDLIDLDKSNSAILLILINLIKITIKKNKTIKLINISNHLIQLAKIYNLNKILIKHF